ncbi:hypothetical protein METH_16170 [Leisingera methylohalidivorans DSM 14336]|uniref:Uncharacterized protein n=1 Tax=Leisingera methylohalidivorans DSM 14336 TaxID=999552 RepID=V9W1Z0_9RHOB|nr:hypothetical protein METH_16170 [Leisingera methylohalidivorans DSM 14336]
MSVDAGAGGTGTVSGFSIADDDSDVFSIASWMFPI